MVRGTRGVMVVVIVALAYVLMPNTVLAQITTTGTSIGWGF